MCASLSSMRRKEEKDVSFFPSVKSQLGLELCRNPSTRCWGKSEFWYLFLPIIPIILWMIGRNSTVSIFKVRVVLELLLFSYLYLFHRNSQLAFMSLLWNILVITGQPWHGQRTVSKPADSSGFRTLLFLAEQLEGVLPCRTVSDRFAGGQLQLSAFLHCWSFKILSQRNSVTDG